MTRLVALSCLLAAAAATGSFRRVQLDLGLAPAAAADEDNKHIGTPALAGKMPLKAVEQGFEGEMVQHKDQQTYTRDWGKEFGPMGPASHPGAPNYFQGDGHGEGVARRGEPEKGGSARLALAPLAAAAVVAL